MPKGLRLPAAFAGPSHLLNLISPRALFHHQNPSRLTVSLLPPFAATCIARSRRGDLEIRYSFLQRGITERLARCTVLRGGKISVPWRGMGYNAPDRTVMSHTVDGHYCLLCRRYLALMKYLHIGWDKNRSRSDQVHGNPVAECTAGELYTYRLISGFILLADRAPRHSVYRSSLSAYD